MKVFASIITLLLLIVLPTTAQFQGRQPVQGNPPRQLNQQDEQRIRNEIELQKGSIATEVFGKNRSRQPLVGEIMTDEEPGGLGGKFEVLLVKYGDGRSFLYYQIRKLGNSAYDIERITTARLNDIDLTNERVALIAAFDSVIKPRQPCSFQITEKPQILFYCF